MRNSEDVDDALELCAAQLARATGPRNTSIVERSCGKSTLLHIVGAMDRPTHGRVSLGGLRDLYMAHLARLRTDESTGVTYWEGSVATEGASGDKTIRGRGYLEMTGYAGDSMGAILR